MKIIELLSDIQVLSLNCGDGLGCVHPHAIYVEDEERPFYLYYTPYPPDSAELPFLACSNNGIRFTDECAYNPLIVRGKMMNGIAII